MENINLKQYLWVLYNLKGLEFEGEREESSH